jgi:PPOX class probable F420-dependent enzyme
VDTEQVRERFDRARVARLATLDAAGPRPHLVPVTFARVGNQTLVTAVDQKPKRTPALRRLRNIAANPRVCVLADHYEDDWTRLWWVRADGVARIGEAAEEPAALAALVARYPQYTGRPPGGPVIVISVERWVGWAAAPSSARADSRALEGPGCHHGLV